MGDSDSDDDVVDEPCDIGGVGVASSSGENGVVKRQHIHHRKKRRSQTTIGEVRVIDLLDDEDENDDVGARDAKIGSLLFRDFTFPRMDFCVSTDDSGSKSPSRRLVACIARASRVEKEEADDVHEPDDQGRIVVNIDVCVLRLGVVGADVLITLSTPRNGIAGGIGKETEEGTSSDDVDGTFRRILETFDVKDWGLFES